MPACGFANFRHGMKFCGQCVATRCDALRARASRSFGSPRVARFFPLVQAALVEADTWRSANGPRCRGHGARGGIELACAGGCRLLRGVQAAARARRGSCWRRDGVVPRAEIESAPGTRRAFMVATNRSEARALSPRILELRGRLAAALGDAPASDRARRCKQLELLPRDRRTADTPSGSRGAGGIDSPGLTDASEKDIDVCQLGGLCDRSARLQRRSSHVDA